MADEKDLIFPMHLDIDPKDFENKWKQVEPKLQAILDARPLKARIDVDTRGLERAIQSIITLKQASLDASAWGSMNKDQLAAYNAITKRMGAEARLNTVNLRSSIIEQQLAERRERTRAATYRADAVEVNLHKARVNLKTATTNNERAELRLEQARQRGIAAVHTQNKAYQAQRGILNGLPQFINSYVSILGAYRLGQNIVDTTAEFEMQRVALAAIIQNKAKADELFSQNVELGLKSPFQIKDLITYTKQLAAYRIETDNLFDTTKRLADVSAGLGVDMSRLILAYGQTAAASVLRGQELRQYTESGIPMVQLLADKFTKLNGVMTTTGDVFKIISERGVSFELVKEIFEDMTNAGGMFYRMQEIQAETLKGSLSNLKDAYQKMFMQIGNGEMGTMKSLIDGIKDLMNNWEIIAKVASNAAVAYGLVKVATIANNIALRKHNVENLASIMTEKKKEAALLRQAAVYRTLTRAETLKIAMSDKLRGADLRQLAIAGKLNKEDALRLLAMRKINIEQINHVKNLLKIESYEIARAKGLSKTTVMFRMAAASVKAYTVALWTAAKAMLTNPMTWTLAAIAGVVKLTSHIINYNKAYSKMSEDMRKNAVSLAGELKDAWENIAQTVARGFSKGASEESMVSARESMRQILEKNEALKPIIENRLSLYDTEAEKLREMKLIWDEINAAASGEGKYTAIIPEVQKTTGGAFFNDDIVENAADVNKKIGEIDARMSRLSAKYGAYTSDIRKIFEESTKEFKDGTIGLDQYSKKLSEIYSKAAQSKNKLKPGKEKDAWDALMSKIMATQMQIGFLGEDSDKFFEGMMNSMEKALGMKLDRHKMGFGLNQNQLSQLHTELAAAFGMWQTTFDDIQRAGMPVLNNVINKVFQFPYRNGKKDENENSKRYNAFLASRKLGNVQEASVKDMSLTDISIREKLEASIESNESALELYNNQVKNGNLINQKSIEGLKETIRQQKIARGWLGGGDNSSNTTNASKTDPRIAALKNQLDIVTEAYQKYIEISEYLGKEEAKKQVTKQYGGQNKPIKGITSGLPLAFTQTELNAAQQSAIVGFGKLGKDAANEGRATFLKQADAAFDEIKRNMQENLDRLARDIEQTQRANEFYEKMLDLTGSKDAAEKLTRSMGMVVGDVRKNMQAALAGSMKVGEVDYGDGVDLNNIGQAQKAINKMISDGATESAKLAQKQLDTIISYRQNELEEILKGSEDFMTAEQKKVIIAEKTKKRIEQIRNNTDLSDKLKEIGISSEKRRGESELANVDFETLRSMDSYVQAFEDLDRVGDATLTKLKAELQALAAQTKDATGLKTITDQILKIEKVQENRNPFGTLISGIREYKEALEELLISEKKYGKESKEYAAAQNKVKKSADKMSDGIKTVKSDFDEAAGAITGVIDLTKKIADQFGITFSEETQEYIDAFTGGIEIASAAIGILTVAVTILDTVLWPLLLVAVAIGAAFLQWKILDSLINMSTTKKLAANVRLIETLEERLKQLARAEDDVIGNEYVKNIKNQIAATKELIAVEESNIETNKKGKHFLWWRWADKEAIAESKENISQYYDDIEQLQEEFMQEMTGYSGVVDAAYAFADAWYNAWLSMDDTTDAIMEKFDEMVDSMIIKSILAEVVAAKLKPLFDEVEAAYANDNKLDMSELSSIQGKLNGLAEGLNADLNAIMGNWLRTGGEDKRTGGENLTGIAAAASSMSEDTANTMGGYLNSGLMQWVKQTGLQTQILAAIQSQDVKTPLANMYQLQQQSLAAINEIKSDTAIMVSRLNTLVENQNASMINGGQKAVNVRLLN